MKKKINQTLKDTLLLLAISLAVTFVWQILELIINGKIEPRGVDTIIGLVLAISICMNIKSFVILRRVKKLIDKWQ